MYLGIDVSLGVDNFYLWLLAVNFSKEFIVLCIFSYKSYRWFYFRLEAVEIRCNSVNLCYSLTRNYIVEQGM
ncbi:endonuclease [Neisseria wadsworthii 9715]|uniref:Endonuclease n=1 Tax=Neisseria wadsworthii 9715 TaxID=1030841 RepID=G4CQW0_9NEIS|nr:endonuclease [Neisseria wadsworthii 9715]